MAAPKKAGAGKLVVGDRAKGEPRLIQAAEETYSPDDVVDLRRLHVEAGMPFDHPNGMTPVAYANAMRGIVSFLYERNRRLTALLHPYIEKIDKIKSTLGCSQDEDVEAKINELALALKTMQKRRNFYKARNEELRSIAKRAKYDLDEHLNISKPTVRALLEAKRIMRDARRVIYAAPITGSPGTLRVIVEHPEAPVRLCRLSDLYELFSALYNPAIHGDLGINGIVMAPEVAVRWEECPAYEGCRDKTCLGCHLLPACEECEGEGQNAHGEDCEVCGGEGRVIPRQCKP